MRENVSGCQMCRHVHMNTESPDSAHLLHHLRLLHCLPCRAYEEDHRSEGHSQDQVRVSPMDP